MSDGQLGEEIRRVVARQGGDLNGELLGLAVRVLRGDLTMCFGYAPADPSPAGCPISTVAWDRDADVPAAEMTEWTECGPVTPHLLAGDKLTFVEAPPSLMEVIENDWAAEAQARRPLEVLT
jgi:surfactin synthase thioesterase subunit